MTIWYDSSLPGFKLPTNGTGSNTIGAAIDLSKPYDIGGVHYSTPLPGNAGLLYTGSKPDMGAVQNGDFPAGDTISAPKVFRLK